jgi:hypothetical protein
VTQPDYVPLAGADRVRPSDRLTLPKRWTADRPGDLDRLMLPRGGGFGQSGPDLGYGLKLAKRFADKLVLTAGEHTADVVAGCFACGSKRAALFGRAPVIYDMQWAYGLWGYLAEAPSALVDLRVPLFRGASHDYSGQRAVVDTVSPGAFQLTPDAVKEMLAASWRTFFVSSHPEMPKG